MARYKIEVSATAEKQLRNISRSDQVRVVNAIIKLAENPCPRGCRKLAGYDDVYRIRVGFYRVIYSVDRLQIIIAVLKIGHRKDIYR
ncbi:MAG: type II toxin-antitoxin system RelE/ParE family toxin [bacterium]|nr:type II toxin-antitoxin system RelE/ParE family toxin [bacterium]